MCGIVGLCAPQVSRPQLEKANQRLRHRGPDDVGVFIDDGIGLAARRLSIIDLEGGHQPLSNEDGTIWITYNGEVMNAPNLRGELQAAGHRFQTQTDTEVVVHAYEEWGTDAFARLRGMFAVGLWDGRTQRLLLVRDRFGVKPLHYIQDGSRLAFASEIRPLFDLLPHLPGRANREALVQLFTWGFVPTPLTMFDKVQKLPAAHVLVWEKGNVTIRPYWRLQFPDQGRHIAMAPETAVAQFRRHLRDAVAAWRLSDVPVGSLLSGGIDSSTLALLLTEISGQSIHTFNIGFEAASHDETGYAKLAAEAIGSRHHTLHFSQADFDHLPEVISHLECPQCSATSVPIYLLYKACHDAGFKVILTGEGADELLGGYHWFDGDRRVRPFLHLPQPLRRLLANFAPHVSRAGKRVLAQGTAADPSARFALWHQVTPPKLLANLLIFHREERKERKEKNINSAPSARYHRPSAVNFSQFHPLNQFLFLEAQTRMVDFINFEVDRMSMAHSVEARPPFLDHPLWEFCAQLPPDLKLKPHLNKWLLRQAMRDKLPAPIRNRPKQGLASPHADWWRQEKLPGWAEDCLRSNSLHETMYFEPETVTRLREAHQNGRTDHSRILMGILTTQLWHEQMEIGNRC